MKNSKLLNRIKIVKGASIVLLLLYVIAIVPFQIAYGLHSNPITTFESTVMGIFSTVFFVMFAIIFIVYTNTTDTLLEREEKRPDIILVVKIPWSETKNANRYIENINSIVKNYRGLSVFFYFTNDENFSIECINKELISETTYQKLTTQLSDIEKTYKDMLEKEKEEIVEDSMGSREDDFKVEKMEVVVEESEIRKYILGGGNNFEPEIDEIFEIDGFPDKKFLAKLVEIRNCEECFIKQNGRNHDCNNLICNTGFREDEKAVIITEHKEDSIEERPKEETSKLPLFSLEERFEPPTDSQFEIKEYPGVIFETNENLTRTCNLCFLRDIPCNCVKCIGTSRKDKVYVIIKQVNGEQSETFQ